MAIAVKTFGHHRDQRVDHFTLQSDTGVEVDIIGYGVSVRDWRVPVKGGVRSVVLGFDTFEPYPEHSPHFGALAGRIANRVENASVTVDGETFALSPNMGRHQLHGGSEGLGRQVWHGEADSAANVVRFSHFSPDGAMGYPGNVEFEAVYSLNGNQLRLELSARPDRKTPISLVQHQYFNLGTGSHVLDHKVQIQASARTELDDLLIANGAILPVENSHYDLQQGRTMRDGHGAPIDFDNNFVLYAGRDLNDPIATVTAPDGDLTLKLWSDRPGLQFYNGVWCDVKVPGLGGRSYKKHAGFCLEDQKFPNAMRHKHFPDILVSPDAPYKHWSMFEIA